MSSFPNLREWQEQAYDAWVRNDYHGCFEVATGGGKTTFALACFEGLKTVRPDLKCVVVVPTTALLDQWYVAFQDDLGFSQERIKVLTSSDLVADVDVNLVIINSARSFNGHLDNAGEVLFVVDECHRAGSPQNAKALVGDSFATIGLSATPRRDFDSGFQDFVVPALGEVLLEYSLEDAIRDGVLAHLSLTYVKIPLLPSEQKEYDELTKKIARAYAIEPGGQASTFLLRKRARLSNDAFYRIPVMLSVLNSRRGKRTLVFVESIAAAKSAKKLLDDSGHSVSIYHSQMSSHLRRANLRGFRKGIFDVLIACRALDEGFNVPEAEVAVIVAGTASRRQRIQRVGRVLRSMADKEFGEVVTLYATPAEELRLVKESEELEGSAIIHWVEASHE